MSDVKLNTTEEKLETSIRHAHRHYAPREGERLWHGKIDATWYWDLALDVWVERDENDSGWFVMRLGERCSETAYTLQEALRIGRALVEQQPKIVTEQQLEAPIAE